VAFTFFFRGMPTLQPIGEPFGLILCKNVLVHLSPQRRVGVFRMFRDALCPGRYLGVEQTQKSPEEARGWFQPMAGAPAFQHGCLLKCSSRQPSEIARRRRNNRLGAKKISADC